jgi:hypothetical protein
VVEKVELQMTCFVLVGYDMAGAGAGSFACEGQLPDAANLATNVAILADCGRTTLNTTENQEPTQNRAHEQLCTLQIGLVRLDVEPAWSMVAKSTMEFLVFVLGLAFSAAREHQAWPCPPPPPPPPPKKFTLPAQIQASVFDRWLNTLDDGGVAV